MRSREWLALYFNWFELLETTCNSIVSADYFLFQLVAITCCCLYSDCNLFGPLCEFFSFIETSLDQIYISHIYWFFMTNLRANSILLPQCNPISFSQFSDSIILKKSISLRPLAQYAWNLVEIFIYESSNFSQKFSSFELHLVYENNFLPKLLKSETALLKLTETNSKLIFFKTNLHTNCIATSTRCV